MQLVKFMYSEYAEPLCFSDIPDWLRAAREDGRIRPYFGGEDYWYLIVQTTDGEVTIGPGEWIRRTLDGKLQAGKAAIS